MDNQYLNIKTGLLFPVQFQILGYVLLLSGLGLLIIHFLTSIILILLGGFIVTAYSGVEFKNHKIREYNSFFFLRFGKWEKLEKVEKIFIKKIKKSQKFYGRANQSSIIREEIYKAFLKFENGKKIELKESRNKTKLEQKIQKLNQYFQTEIVDYSS